MSQAAIPFCPEEIQAAIALRARGLRWTPRVGHYVWDGEGLIEPSSPFGGRLYYILDLKHFLRRTETVERLAGSMTWLPTWNDARGVLRGFGVADDTIAARLQESHAFRNQRELLALYGMIAEHLTSQA